MGWTRPRSGPPRRQPSPSPEIEGPESAASSGCFGACLGVLASTIAFVVLLTLGSIFVIFERPDRHSLLAWLGVALGAWLLSGVVAYAIAGRLGASPLAMGFGALIGFALLVVALVLFV